MKELLIREYKPKDRKIVERCIFELQEDDSARQPDYWQPPKKALKDKYLDYLLKRVKKNSGKLLVAEKMAPLPDM